MYIMQKISELFDYFQVFFLHIYPIITYTDINKSEKIEKRGLV